MRRRPAAAALLGAALVGCGVTPATPPALAPPVPPTAEAATLEEVSWSLPIVDGALPTEPNLLPNASREYRGGIHQGVDFYFHANGDGVACNEAVLNARFGYVIRADHAFVPVSPKEYEAAIAALKVRLDEDRLDRLRGRQVWVRCEDGTVVRYCHLLTVDPAVQVGLRVARGVRLGGVGNTGTQDGANATGKNCHLHFEVWPKSGNAYLGQGDAPARARGRYAELFGIK